MKRAVLSLGMVLALISSSVLGQPVPTTRPVPGATTRPRPGANAPSPDQLMNSMLRPPVENSRLPLQPLPDPLKVDTATGKTVAPNPPQPVLRREGSPILDRTGRLTKSADGQSSEFTFDSDGKNMLDPPLGILPNLNLMAMENLVSGSSKDARFRISGSVTEYKGRNYVLIEKVTAVPDATQQF